MVNLKIQTPRWCLPLLEKSRYKAAKGGRAGGKSHFFAERAVERFIEDPDLSFVGIREIQRSLKNSAKKLIASKIRSLGASHYFNILDTEIRSTKGDGVMIFEGMQDHTADTIKSLEGFDIAWVEEAQKLSLRSLKLLRPTIRAEDSEIWFSWNPEQPTDAVDNFFCGDNPPGNTKIVHVNYDQNPFLTDVSYDDMERDRKNDPDGFAHTWLGDYNVRSDAQILSGKWKVEEFTPDETFGRPYFGADWGFSQDPTVLLKKWIKDNVLYIEDEAWGIGVDIADTPALFDRIKDSRKYMIRADCARPETISHVRKAGFQIEGAKKWKGSVEDGISYLRSFDKIIIHPRCIKTEEEARRYSYKICKMTGDILPDIVDKYNHCIDGMRYGLAPLIKPLNQVRVF